MSAMKSSSSLMYCLMHSMAAVVHCGGGEHNPDYPQGANHSAIEARRGASLFYWACSNEKANVEPHPRQRRDHVLLDDGGFRQPRADVCADKLRERPCLNFPSPCCLSCLVVLLVYLDQQ